MCTPAGTLQARFTRHQSQLFDNSMVLNCHPEAVERLYNACAFMRQHPPPPWACICSLGGVRAIHIDCTGRAVTTAVKAPGRRCTQPRLDQPRIDQPKSMVGYQLPSTIATLQCHPRLTQLVWQHIKAWTPCIFPQLSRHTHATARHNDGQNHIGCRAHPHNFAVVVVVRSQRLKLPCLSTKRSG
jgi:hypothetical protein